MRLPAYGRDLIALQKTGRNVAWLVISLDFALGRALPRVVVADDIGIGELDLRCVAGLECTVAHEGKPSRALDVAYLALKNGAARCGVHDCATSKSLTTNEVLAIKGAIA